MKNWSGKVVLVLAIVALLFTILGNPVVQERVSTFTPTSLVGREIKDILTVGMSNVVYAAVPDYTCDGVDDNVQVQQALTELPSTGGKIILFAGNYSFGATVLRAINNVTFEGSGKGAYLTYNASSALISAGSQSGWLFKDMATDGGALNIGSATNSYIISCWIGATYTNTLQDIHVAAADPHTGYILESLVDAKGDIIVAAADNTISRLGVGSNTQVLTADSTQAAGIKWAAAAGGGAGMYYPITNPVLATTRHIPYASGSTALTTLATTANRLYYIPFILLRNVTLTELGINVTTLLAGKARCGIYSNSNFRPASKLVETADLDTGATGYKSSVVSLALEAGTLYWAAVLPSVAVTIRAVAVASMEPIMGVGNTATAHNAYYYEGLTSGWTTLPATTGTLTNGTGITPVVFMNY